MCVGIPAQVIEAGDFVARCRTRNGEEQVNMMLTGSQPVGTWLLTFLGSAREVITEQDARQINQALDGLSAIMSGEEEIDVDHYFPDIKPA
ncbi:MAG: HypC/HybG/HupF family hydrogenase formation chaperone [gamma proteobacterium symbiont of Ctena orbiculata]|nr:HypC/HybG/HupF family hydrogenase formation chaperone [Candidatus Thiodiazotropha taylori]MBT3060408.1 HypC/HybG/HupF family hydrogenase formation chaperone [Candidatus Thiodiazotropha sp. (ex Lucina pensylvanica)]MBT3064407.1 HypC/HybG/HupF family hydrogenase formation chaperone [Candidatus Thiodiazotropha sp. (ex Lucina pensylvanica)]MBV2093309.1 HypC/HybG/HupF family hydrogenase formation chaperone [Candidatus Thiodiazotropha sp. (ex Codakia orbicularis)]PUB72856.1 MAG: HypC/HybG/HupF fam